MTIELMQNKKYIILDMDGTFYLGDRLLEGSLDFISHVRESGKDFIFFTNNSSKNAEVYVRKLTEMGCPVDTGKVITSGMVTADYLKTQWKKPQVFLLGTPLLEEDFKERGILLTNENPQESPDVVVAGFDTTLTYEKLSQACGWIRKGVPFVATHLDYNCPTEDGFIPDCGAICAFITASTGVLPKYLGKPFQETLDYIQGYLGCSRDELIFIGDRLYTDIAIGVNHGVSAVLVLTGETQLQDVEASDIKPDLIIDRLADLTAYL